VKVIIMIAGDHNDCSDFQKIWNFLCSPKIFGEAYCCRCVRLSICPSSYLQSFYQKSVLLIANVSWDKGLWSKVSGGHFGKFKVTQHMKKSNIWSPHFIRNWSYCLGQRSPDLFTPTLLAYFLRFFTPNYASTLSS
jgi:hypothetical protein